ncbi:GGDEF domain-containing protein [Corallincola spongiicola]|uniref:diguanylate cyclase n=1 Tax=Corallincola spongiicola TaxID=2520508 RepID=A0ABY1WTL0_9GAMM|nr:GGDEF domain-containing protein [Corallincola spongiicola]TAA48057.1 GGDEF domain-containing protein [Corallincola spongiicola]
MRYLMLIAVFIYWTPLAGYCADETNTEQLLLTAERLRVSDTGQVKVLIERLEASADLTPVQRDRLSLLQAHQHTLYGRYESAKHIISELFYSDLKPAQELRAYHLLSQVADLESDYGRAFSYLNYALQLLPKVNSEDAQLSVLTLAAELFSRASAHDKALQYVEQAVAISTIADGVTDGERCMVAKAASVIYLNMSRYDAALKTAEQQLGYCQLSSEKLYAANAHSVIADVYVNRLAYEQALEHYELAENDFVELNYLYGVINTRLAKASLAVELGTPATSLAMLASLIPNAIENNLWDELQQPFLLAAELSEQQGDLKSALIYYRQYMIAVQKVMDDNKAMRIAYLQTEFETEQQAQQLELLEKDKVLLTLRENAINQQRWLLASILAGAVLLLIVLLMLLTRYRQRNLYYRQLSEVDGLTKVFNRRHAYEHGEKLLKSSLACSEPFAVIMADIDHFKAVNDTYGHRIGDRVLQTVANQLKEGLRGHDIIARAGGEEFVLFLPRASYQQAMHIAERCKSALRPIQAENRTVTITLSFGISVAEGQAITLSELVEQADQALYASKNSGRNRISLYREIEESPAKSDKELAIVKGE